MLGIEYLQYALLDLENMIRYITYRCNNPDLARKIQQEIEESLKKARENPWMYPVFPFESKNSAYPSTQCYEYRKIIVRNYLIFFVVDEEKNKIIVVRVLNGRSDYRKEF